MEIIKSTLSSYGIELEHVLLMFSGAIAILMITVLVLIIINCNMAKKYKKFMKGKDAKSLEEEIDSRMKKLEDFDKNINTIKNNIRIIEDKLASAVQKIGIEKYDAFNEMGGKLSFTAALLDEENTGIVINSVHSREGCYTYAKEIVKGEAFVLLADEEKRAIDKAIKSKSYVEKAS